MTRQDQIDLVARYFAGVDGQDLGAVLETLTPDVVFTVPTHGVRVTGHDGVSGMLNRLWRNHAAVRHTDFTHVCDPEAGRVAARFRVENTEHDGSVTTKFNCNFFDMRDGRFSAVAVYMAGANTLDAG